MQTKDQQEQTLEQQQAQQSSTPASHLCSGARAFLLQFLVGGESVDPSDPQLYDNEALSKQIASARVSEDVRTNYTNLLNQAKEEENKLAGDLLAKELMTFYPGCILVKLNEKDLQKQNPLPAWADGAGKHKVSNAANTDDLGNPTEKYIVYVKDGNNLTTPISLTQYSGGVLMINIGNDEKSARLACRLVADMAKEHNTKPILFVDQLAVLDKNGDLDLATIARLAQAAKAEKIELKAVKKLGKQEVDEKLQKLLDKAKTGELTKKDVQELNKKSDKKESKASKKAEPAKKQSQNKAAEIELSELYKNTPTPTPSSKG